MPAVAVRFDRLRAAVALPTPDAALVARYAADRDDAAFAELVRRHGPMVLAVCRRVVGDAHLADDAYQATFVVFARKAAAVSVGESAGGYLHAVAYRTALDARTRFLRRRSRETPTHSPPDRPAPPDPDVESLRALDEEIARLPAHLRAAVVLCELEGRTRPRAAALLGVPEGTLSSRLAAARKRLAEALTRRGLAVPAIVAATAVPAVSASPHPGSPAVAALAAAPTAGVAKWLLAAALVVAAGLSFPAATPPPAPAAAPRESRVLVWVGDRFARAPGKEIRVPPLLLKPDGTVAAEIPVPTIPSVGPSAGLLSPDGKRVAYSFTVEHVTPANSRGGLGRQELFVRTLGDPAPDRPLKTDGRLLGWSKDGKRLYAMQADWDAIWLDVGKIAEWQSVAIDVATGKRTPLPLTKTMQLRDVSPDESTFLGETVEVIEGRVAVKTFAIDRAGKTTELPNADGKYQPARFSPDGTRVLYTKTSRNLDDVAFAAPLAVLDVKANKLTPVTVPELTFGVIAPGGLSACWSPDGKRVAFAWIEMADPATLPKAARPGVPLPGQLPKGVPPPPPLPPGAPAPARPPLKVFPYVVTACDPDGKNPTTLLSTDKWAVHAIDWK